ncbi:hypothetical protein DN069_19875 [Streptacidiphilus pinicola]|uniref:Uncharacterized protein n=1 Tax=Streptacidiphilus pinicola TaxID=2219663 RepID=A0A2X0IH33_9ACTN|nr:DUF6191 domain-containing protein [Streptacidiphilus pinicola]RAG83867.1 hypothetical protein DN069_19875 [Streptacidiphilus pinicola]
MALGLLITSALVAVPLFFAALRHVIVHYGHPRRLARRFAAKDARRPGGSAGGFGIMAAEELQAFFNGNKRVQLEHKQEQLTLRDDDHASGAPPRTGVDLERGTAVLRLPPRKP